MNIKGIVAMLFAGLLLAACQSTEQRIEQEGAVRFSRAELVEFLSGKTERWTNGAGYFAPDGTLEALWKGETFSGKWRATDAGEVCYDVTEWKNTACATYYHQAGKVVTVYEGKLEEAKDGDYLAGNQLQSF